MKRIYFEGLNEIRAIAALAVLFHHVELYKERENIANLFDTFFNSFIATLGKNGVYLFFVLSGFLITYLLLSEKEERGKIDIKKFYIRRILRIWPLYYLVVLIAFSIPFWITHFESFQEEKYYFNTILELNNYYFSALLLFLVFLPNLALITKKVVVGASQAWSVGVEEQFYLIWPQVIQRAKKDFLLYIFFFISLIPVPIKFLSFILPDVANSMNDILEFLPIHFMATGAIGGYMVFYHKEKIEPLVNNPILFALNTVILLVFLFIYFNKMFFGYILMFEILFVTEGNFRFNLRNKILDKLGEISYGIYMYHPLVMFCCFTFVHSTTNLRNTGLFYHALVYVLIIIFTLIISHLSYFYFEKRFVDLKNKNFTVVFSGKEG